MKWHRLLLLLIALASGVAALTVSEESALQAILSSVPGLALVEPAWTENTTNACGPQPFYGLTCSEGPEPHVTRIEFADATLNGSIPSAVDGLQWLSVLSAKNGCYWNVLPSTIGTLSNLTVLEFEVFNFCAETTHTTMLEDVGRLTRLENLTLTLGRLNGSLPENIGSLASLRHLTIRTPDERSNELRGDLPSTFPQLFSTLVTLRLERTLLGRAQPGPFIPGNLALLTHVSFSKSYNLDANIYLNKLLTSSLKHLDFSWSLMAPSVHAINLWNVEYINLEGSAIKWTNFPDNFWSYIPNAQFVSLAGTDIQGSIGDSVGYAKSLRHLNLSRIALTGNIPPSISHLPLESLVLEKMSLSHPLPPNFGLLNATMRHLAISHLTGEGPLPNNLAAFTRLEVLTLSNGGFTGTIPAEMSQFTNLTYLFIDNNALEGPLPDLHGEKKLQVDAHNNRLNGTIPRSLASRVTSLVLSHNLLASSEDDSTLFASNEGLQLLDLSHNLLSSNLPNLTTVYLDLSFNNFSGEVPASYCMVDIIDLSQNDLSGSLEGLFDPTCSTATEIRISSNNFSTLPDISRLSRLQTLSIANNLFAGTLPLFNDSLLQLDASYNRLNGSNMREFVARVKSGKLRSLDLSGNGIDVGESYISLIGPSMRYLLLGSNRFTNPPRIAVMEINSLVGLDLSNNNISGTFTVGSFRDLAVLKLADNAFKGDLYIGDMPSLTHVDISNNKFSFDVGRFKALPLLMRVNARNNQLFGSLELGDGLPNLAIADFSGNLLDQVPNLASAGALFAGAAMEILNISNNPLMPNFTGLPIANTLLERTSSSAPSNHFPDTVICYELSFSRQSGNSFIFDEGLFSYAQCDCNQAHFGKPPSLCIKCPSRGVSTCGGTQVNVTLGNYAYLVQHDPLTGENSPLTTDDRFENLSTLLALTWTSMKASLGIGAPIAEISTSYPQNLMMETESCLLTPVQTISNRSNCGGVRITAADLAKNPAPTLLDTQCKGGSAGRLCSRCKCKPSEGGKCWYKSNAGCTQCRFVFATSTSFPLAVAVVLLLFAVLSTLMAFVIRNRRIQRLSPYENLPLYRRIFYRLLTLVSVGNLSILITFVQILIAITRWDGYWKAELIGILNGDVSGMGLPCLFPFLSDPLWSLLLQLSIPFLGVIFIALATAVGAAVAKVLEARALKKASALIVNDSEGEELALLTKNEDKIAIKYPAKALMVSVSISFIKFFYFGTALAAHENLFSVSQPITRIEYMQNTPWLAIKAWQSWSLVATSIPTVLIFDFVIPFVFFIICLKVRNRLQSPSVRSYFGSLFETYDPRCFWWEIVSIMKKLSIALVLQGFLSSDAVQSALIVSILVGAILIQLNLHPWRRKVENFMDIASSLLLICALVFTRSNQTHASGVIWYMFSIAVVYIATSIGIIIWRTLTDKTDYEKQLERFLAAQEGDVGTSLDSSDSSVSASL